MKQLLFSLLALGLMTTTSLYAGTLDDVKKRGSINCGVSEGLPGFGAELASGNWEGFDIDFCRALSAAIFGSPQRVKYIPLNSKKRFSTLASGEIDILSRNSTWTFARDTNLGLNFAGVSFYDGQGFMVKKSLRAKKAKDLNGATICINEGTSTEANVAEFFKANGLRYKPVLFPTQQEAAEAYNKGICNVYTADKSALASFRLDMNKPKKHKILNDSISKEPLGPVVREGDEQWFDIVKWTLNALIEAEELGINSDNVTSLNPSNPYLSRFLGKTGKNGDMLGLKNDWVVKVILSVGNYGEIYERHLGEDTDINIPRGLNNLWREEGLMYSKPF